MTTTSITKEFHRVSEQVLAITFENQCRAYTEISTLYEKKYNVSLDHIAKLLGYRSDRCIIYSLPLLRPILSFSIKEGKKITPTTAAVDNSAYCNRPSYETLLERLELTKHRIKELLAKPDNSLLDCSSLRAMYKEKYKHDLQQIPLQLGYFSIIHFFESIPGVPWKIPLIEVVGYPLLMCASSTEIESRSKAHGLKFDKHKKVERDEMINLTITRKFYVLSERLLTIYVKKRELNNNQLCDLFKMKYGKSLQMAAKEIDYSPMILLQSLSFLERAKKEHYHLVELAVQNRSTYEQLLKRRKKTKKRIKKLLATSENPHIDCPGLRHEYKEKHNDELELAHRQLGYYSLPDLLKTIPDMPWSVPLFDAPGYPLFHGPPSVEEVTTSLCTTENESRPENKTTITEQCKEEEEEEGRGGENSTTIFTQVHSFSDYAMNSIHTVTETEEKHESSPRSSVCSLSREIDSLSISSQNAESERKLSIILKRSRSTQVNKHLFLGDAAAADTFDEMALLGHLYSDRYSLQSDETEQDLYLHTHIPFCMAAIGVQGAGKSHTLGCFLESCLLSNTVLSNNKIIRLQKPMTTLVLHYDLSTTSVCESAGLLTPSPYIEEVNVSIPKSQAVILVSPTFYLQRKHFYGDYCTVRPLLFRWSSLTADHIKRLMCIKPGDNQLYIASFMSLLRKYQRKDQVPDFTQFIEEVKQVCNVRGQSGPLDQRIVLLESIVAESFSNRDMFDESMDLQKAVTSNMKLITIDLTDPLLSKEDANSLFQVVTEQFRSAPVKGGKVLALDEAHKFMDGVKSDGLSQSIVNVARLMRHDGIRLMVSTQSPMALAPELLELVSVAVLHHFHSRNWWDYLRQKLPLEINDFSRVLDLAPGEALVFSSRHNFSKQCPVINLRVRNRLTADFGSSRVNR